MNVLHIIFCFYLFTPLSKQQHNKWSSLKNETIHLNKSGTYQANQYAIQIIWDDSLYKTANGFYSGIKSATFFYVVMKFKK